jgi:hypothetical protein
MGQNECVTRDISRIPLYISRGPRCISKGCSVHSMGALPMSTSQREWSNVDWALWRADHLARDTPKAHSGHFQRPSAHFKGALGTFVEALGARTSPEQAQPPCCWGATKPAHSKPRSRHAQRALETFPTPLCTFQRGARYISRGSSVYLWRVQGICRGALGIFLDTLHSVGVLAPRFYAGHADHLAPGTTRRCSKQN